MYRLYIFFVNITVGLISFFCFFSFFFCSVSHSEIRTTLSLQGLSFLSSDYESTSKKNFMFLGITLRSDAKSQDAFKINLTGQYAIGESLLSYLNIREIYFTTKIDDTSVLYLGRKLQNWSSLDTVWNLSVFQPQFKWNPLTPENQGLTGIFWNKNNANLGVTVFISPLYLPDQGPSFELKDGQFQSGNPWFSAPPQNIKFQGQLLPIDYEITKPEMSSVIFQTQYGAQVRLMSPINQKNQSSYFANFAAMSKPANQFALGYKGVLVTTRVKVDVTPKVYFENIGSADIGYRRDWGVAQLSFLYTKPQSPTFDSTFNTPEFEQSLMWGPQILYKYKPFEFLLGYLDTSGGSVKDIGPDVSADRASLSQRFLYKQALQLQAKYKDIFWNQMVLNTSLQFMTSSKEGFRQIRFKSAFNFRSSWNFWLDLLLIDTDSSILTNIEPYKSSDQIWLGVNYDI